MNLSELMNKNTISFDIELKDKNEVFDYLINQLYENNSIASKETFKEAVCFRETLSETGLGEGIAIPHGKSATVNKASIAFVRLHDGIAWESLDDKPIQYVFLLAIPETSQDNQHIRMISELARSLIRQDVIGAVKNADDAETLLRVI